MTKKKFKTQTTKTTSTNGLSTDIAESLARLDANGDTQQIIDDVMRDQIRKIVSDSLTYGAAADALRKKINDTVVKAIEGWDIGKADLSLDLILQDVLSQCALEGRRNILRNFRNIMATPPSDDVTVQWLLDAYARWLSDAIRQSDLELEENDEYIHMNLSADVSFEEDCPEWSIRYAVIELTCACDEMPDETFSKVIRLWRAGRTCDWRVDEPKFANARSLRYMDDFDTTMANIAMAGLSVTDVNDVIRVERKFEIPVDEINEY